MKFILLIPIFTLLFVSCSRKTPGSVAVEFKKMQYIHFDSTYEMLHPDTNLETYDKFNNKQDFRKLNKYIKNFKIKVVKEELVDENEVFVYLNITKPDIAKIIPVFGNNTKEDNIKLLDSDKLPSHSFDAKVHLKKDSKKWKVIMGK